MCYKYFYTNLELFLKVLDKLTFPFVREIEKDTFIIPISKTDYILIRKHDLYELPSLCQRKQVLLKVIKLISNRSVIKNGFYRIIYDEYDDIQSWYNLEFKGIAVGIKNNLLLCSNISTIDCRELDLIKLDNYIYYNDSIKNSPNMILKAIMSGEFLIANSDCKISCQIINDKFASEINTFDGRPLQISWLSPNKSKSLVDYRDNLKFIIGPNNKISKYDLYKILCFYGIYIYSNRINTDIIKLEYQNNKLYSI